MRGCSTKRFSERNSFDACIARTQQIICPVLDPLRHLGIGGTAVGGVVLEASVFRRVVGRRDYDAVCEMILATAVVDENGPRDNGSRSHALALLDDRHLAGHSRLDRKSTRLNSS